MVGLFHMERYNLESMPNYVVISDLVCIILFNMIHSLNHAIVLGVTLIVASQFRDRFIVVTLFIYLFIYFLSN